MPATSRYPWETDDVFKQRMMGQNPQAFGVPPVPMAKPQAGNIAPGMLGGGIGPQPAAGPSPLAPQSPMQDMGPPSPMGSETLGQGPPAPMAPPSPFGPLAGGYGQATPPGEAGAVLDDLTSINSDVQAEKGLVDQLEQARALRNTEMPEGHMAGRVFVAPNALQYIGAGIKQYKGGKKEKATEAELAKNRSEQGRKEGKATKIAAEEKGWGNVFLNKFRKDDKDKSGELTTMPSIFDPLINDPEDKAQNQALIDALRRQDAIGTVGLGMGTQSTMAMGQSMVRGAQQSFGEAMQARERAKQQKMQQAQLQAEAAQRQQAQGNWQQNFAENQRQFGVQEQRLADQQKRQYSAIGDPITGQSRIYNTFTGEWKDTAGGTPQAGGDGKPMGPTGYPKIPAGIKLPENASKNYIGSSMLAEHLPSLEGMISGGYSPSRSDMYAVGPPMGGGTGAIQGITPRGMASDQGAQYYATGGKILTAILRPESGGAITGDEWNQYGPLYLPWPGDPPETIKAKMTNLREYMRRLAAGSGPASNFFVEPPVGQPGQTGRQEPRAGDKYLE